MESKCLLDLGKYIGKTSMFYVHCLVMSDGLFVISTTYMEHWRVPVLLFTLSLVDVQIPVSVYGVSLMLCCIWLFVGCIPLCYMPER
jgi:hypothetical protein